MPVDIVNIYLEIQQLRKAVRKAELDLMISRARPPDRSLHTQPVDVSGLPMTGSQTLPLKRWIN
jgi:hypothetical protein